MEQQEQKLNKTDECIKILKKNHMEFSNSLLREFLGRGNIKQSLVEIEYFKKKLTVYRTALNKIEKILKEE